MCPNLSKAKEIMLAEGCTCVLCRDNVIYRSSIRGVKPLLEMLESRTDTIGFCASDKVVGKAAAMLYCLLQVRQVYAPVMSSGAVQILTDHSIEAVYDLQVDAILNRGKDGLCPMEMATQMTDDPNEALLIIRKTLKCLHRE